MRFHRPVDELIRSRYSCRAYLNRRIEPAKMGELKEACTLLKQGLAGESARFQLIELDDRELMRVEPYDFSLIINPRTFIVGGIQKSPLAYETCGYLLEHLVLTAVDLNLGTCWLGYFNRGFFREIELARDEILPAVCVVGYAAEPQDISWRMRVEDFFFLENFSAPAPRDLAGDYAASLDMVRLAPSSGNSQPWRIVKERDRNAFHFYKETVDRQYERKKLHNIDLGIAMCHFELAARENNLPGQWEKVTPNIRYIPPFTEYIISWLGKTGLDSGPRER